MNRLQGIQEMTYLNSCKERGNRISQLTPISWAYSVCRVFIDTAISGCGNGCKYCYVASSLDRQSLYERVLFLQHTDQLHKSPSFKLGRTGTLISLCPHTEPFKSSESTKLVEAVLKTFLPLANPIQISTKEQIPRHIVKLIKANQQYAGQVVMFVSLTTLTEAKIIEPRAAPPEKRLENIATCKSHNVICCLYIKPLLKQTLRELPLFIDLVRSHEPSAVCVGIRYHKEKTLSPYSHPADPAMSSLGPNRDTFRFASEIRSNCKTLTFHSSSCVSAYFRNWFTGSLIWRRHPELCVQCRDCNTDYLITGPQQQ
jgi:DNA repair photolyase